uniref:Ycf58 n=1 Tax=Gracilaria hainanensis TaxID=2871843 RepID=A0AAU7YQQ0_9FLOR
MTYENILNKLEGKWICQRTNYFLDEKKINYNQREIKLQQIHNINISQKKDDIVYHYQIHSPQNNQKIYYLFFKKKQSEYGELHKITNDQIKYYRFKIYTCNCIKIESVKKSIIYYEYIYLINPKFKITIAVLKNKHKYLAASFISEIKISN